MSAARWRRTFAPIVGIGAVVAVMALTGCTGSQGSTLRGEFDTMVLGQPMTLQFAMEVTDSPTFTPEPENPENGTFDAPMTAMAKLTNTGSETVELLPTSMVVRARLIAAADDLACEIPLQRGSGTVTLNGKDFCLSPYSIGGNPAEMELAAGQSVAIDPLSGMTAPGQLTVVVVPDTDAAREAYAAAYFNELAGVCLTTSIDAGPDDYDACILKDGSVITP